MTKPTTRTFVTFLFVVLCIPIIGVASALRADQITDQRQRDLTRVLSEIVHRAQSQSMLDQVVRPEFASARISLSAPDLHDGWTPSCDVEVLADPSDPSRNLQGLVLVPRDRVLQDGSGFDAFAFFVGETALSSADFAAPHPAWLTQEAGGYSSIAHDVASLFSGLAITVETTECGTFSFYTISGEAS